MTSRLGKLNEVVLKYCISLYSGTDWSSHYPDESAECMEYAQKICLTMAKVHRVEKQLIDVLTIAVTNLLNERCSVKYSGWKEKYSPIQCTLAEGLFEVYFRVIYSKDALHKSGAFLEHVHREYQVMFNFACNHPLFAQQWRRVVVFLSRVAAHYFQAVNSVDSEGETLHLRPCPRGTRNLAIFGSDHQTRTEDAYFPLSFAVLITDDRQSSLNFWLRMIRSIRLEGVTDDDAFAEIVRGYLGNLEMLLDPSTGLGRARLLRELAGPLYRAHPAGSSVCERGCGRGCMDVQSGAWMCRVCRRSLIDS